MFYDDGGDCSAEVAPSRSIQPSGHQFPNYDCDIFKLEDWMKFKKYLRERAVRFLRFPKLQYVEVQNVSTSDMEHIDYIRRRGDLPQMRVLYDEEKEVMIVKLMPGLVHEVVAMKFHDLFREMVPSSAGVVAVGSTRFGEVVKRHKEPDQAYLPRGTRLPNPDWPSIVLEVGVSETLRQLHEDARYWLTSGEGRVFTVILISITLNTGEARWERWENEPIVGTTIGVVTRSHSRTEPTLMQFVTLPRSGPVSGDPFLIPTNKIWDVVPNNFGADIIFTAQQLHDFSTELVDCLQ